MWLVKNMKKEEIATENLPNIKFVGKVEIKGETVTGEPPSHINTAIDVIALPDAETQIAGFYHSQAGRICSLFPHLYKEFKPKGT